MITIEEFREYGHQLVDWMADYYKDIEKLPVKPRVNPGDILNAIPESPPEKGESMDVIFDDFKNKIMPGITHWQNPKWFAYFQANSSYPSVLAEMLTATLAQQGMLWETSPAATELEERVMDWLRKMMGLPSDFHGVIQDTASTATLCALLSAREKASGFKINEDGYKNHLTFRVYASTETHSSIDKAVRIAGIGQQNLVKIPTGETLAIDTKKLAEAIEKDLADGLTPLCVVASIGTTGTMAIDPLNEVGDICRHHNIWLHVDGAYVGSAMILPEYRWMIDGIDKADSYVFNPHKWMFTNFDLSAYFVKDKETLIRTFSILPEYLKTRVDDQVNNYRDWGIQLGRRFRALKLWVVIRNFGLEGIRERFRNHIAWMQALKNDIQGSEDFELLAPAPLNMVCFRYHPPHTNDQIKLDEINKRIVQEVNATGETYLTHTKINGIFTIRLVAGQTYLEERHIREVWKTIREIAANYA